MLYESIEVKLLNFFIFWHRISPEKFIVWMSFLTRHGFEMFKIRGNYAFGRIKVLILSGIFQHFKVSKPVNHVFMAV